MFLKHNDTISNELFRKNEIEINKENQKLFVFFSIVCLLGCGVNLLTDDPKYFQLDLTNWIFLLVSFLIIHLASILIKKESAIYKYVLLFWFYLPIMVETTLSTDYFWLAFAIPILLSCRYYNIRLLFMISVFTQICVVLTTVAVAYIQPIFGYARASSLKIPTGLNIIGDGRWMSEVAASFLQQGTVDKKGYLERLFFGHTIYYAIILIAISGCCLLITVHEIGMLEKQNRMLEDKRKMDVNLAESRYRIMVSQIQPHFIFNVLNSAIVLCDEDPEKAQDMLETFSNFLRYDISSIANESLISFKEEIKSVQQYLKLEKIRFGDRLNVAYDLQVKDFMIPPLSMQPLVENAVRHGVCKKLEGGTIRISTKEEDNCIFIIIEDDGVGFDLSKIDDSKKDHVGLSNVKARLQYGMGADMDVESVIGEGTTIRIRIPKKSTNTSLESIPV